MAGEKWGKRGGKNFEKVIDAFSKNPGNGDSGEGNHDKDLRELKKTETYKKSGGTNGINIY